MLCLRNVQFENPWKFQKTLNITTSFSQMHINLRSRTSDFTFLITKTKKSRHQMQPNRSRLKLQ